MTQPFPFSAIVGQDEMKLSMILTAIDRPRTGRIVAPYQGSSRVPTKQREGR